jgi:hypothetical protein
MTLARGQGNKKPRTVRPGVSVRFAKWRYRRADKPKHKHTLRSVSTPITLARGQSRIDELR